ncbi:MAG: hypothetical protein HYX48_03225 [Chlamydiales bacterium]|nr:hypothetical protein [Chlamydiales bacterium]
MKRLVCALLVLMMPQLYAGWAEERLEEMSLDEKIGQLFIMPACPLRGEDHLADLQVAIEKFHIGGIILKQGSSEGQLQLISTLQHLAKVPLLCTGDAEWGLGMRLENTLSFPRNLTLGAIQNKQLIYELGKEIGRQCKIVGLHLNFAPVVDVNINPKNPIIHMRSFGDNPQEVAERAALFMEGLQESGVAASIKHFIGHGDTNLDSHQALPTIPFTLDRLESVELYPFQKLIDKGAMTLVTGHLLVPELDDLMPVTLSRSIVTDLLKKKMGFKGIVISDALNMKAISLFAETDKVALGAFNAGHDLLLYGDHIAPNIDEILRVQLPQAFFGIKRAVESKSLSEEELDQRVLKVLKFKEELKVHMREERASKEEITTLEAKQLKRRLFREAITLVRNERHALPLKPHARAALIQIGRESQLLTDLFKAQGAELVNLTQLPEREGAYDMLIVALCNVNQQQPNFGLKEEELKLLSELRTPTTLILFGTPYALRVLPTTSALIAAYEEDPDTFEAARDLVYGKLIPTGSLPIKM